MQPVVQHVEPWMRLHIDANYLDESGKVCDAKAYARKARMVEAAGLNGIFNSTGFAGNERTVSDSTTWTLIAATATEHLEVGIACIKLPLFEPIDFAQRLMTLETMVPGRYTVGIGSGSGPKGFAALGLKWEDRFRITRDNMRKIRRLLNGETVDEANIAPFPEHLGGPHFVLAAWHSDISLKRAIREYDGWMTSCGNTNFNNLSEGIKKYRDLGGKRAMAMTGRIDLTAPTTKLADDESYTFYCGPEEAAERIQRLAELGYDDLGLHFYRNGKRACFTAEDLEQIRSLLPRDQRKPYAD